MKPMDFRSFPLKISKLIEIQRGFTLIELLVVITILGVLAAVTFPRLTGFIGRGREEAAIEELQIVQKAVYTYMTEEGVALITPHYEPVQLGPNSPIVGDYLLTATGWTYTWDSQGLVAQGERAG
jgi:prepilin-type N-terminal cleavage/methylation domain-containing protein